MGAGLQTLAGGTEAIGYNTELLPSVG